MPLYSRLPSAIWSINYNALAGVNKQIIYPEYDLHEYITRTFVPIDKGMVFYNAFDNCCCFLQGRLVKFSITKTRVWPCNS